MCLLGQDIDAGSSALIDNVILNIARFRLIILMYAIVCYSCMLGLKALFSYLYNRGI